MLSTKPKLIAPTAALALPMGAETSKLFLNGMIKHHMGAITMAETELKEGANPVAKKLAQAIIDAQQAEIIEMKKLEIPRPRGGIAQHKQYVWGRYGTDRDSYTRSASAGVRELHAG